MRLFVAIPLPPDILEYIHSLQKQLPEADMKTASEPHLTLRFLGEIQPEKVETVKEKLSKITFQPFTLQFEKLGIFKDHKGFIKAVWVGLKESEPLMQLVRSVREALKNIGEEDKKDFIPHLTLARVRFLPVGGDHTFEKSLAKIPVDQRSFLVQNFCLFESRLGKSDPRYLQIACFG